MPESIAAMASEYGQHFKKVVRRVTIPGIVAEMLLHREQDGASKVYLGQLRTTLKRFAKVKSADQVALEAGNSPSVIFKNYRELTTEDQADEWFGILPKKGQWENVFKWDRRARIVTLPDSEKT